LVEEVYISVDIEAAGPIPGEYSLLSIGACVVGREGQSFYAELKPLNRNAVPEALAVSGFDLDALERDGQDPAGAMAGFSEWVENVAEGRVPVFVGFNAGFDWGFVNWYLHKFLGKNPFGFAPLDIKAYYMGLAGCAWQETTSGQLPREFQPSSPQTHNALDDAKSQAEIFEKLISAKPKT
jgi:ribonuclease T